MHAVAAGLTGLLMAMAALSNEAAPPIASLRSVNPYVGSTLAEWGGSGLHAAVPRQLAPSSALLPGLCVGMSLPHRASLLQSDVLLAKPLWHLSIQHVHSAEHCPIADMIMGYAGTSSFGLSGINCHSVLAKNSTDLPDKQGHAVLPWLHMRCWAVPQCNLLLAAATVSQPGTAAFACDLGAAHMAFLHDHQ